MNDCKILFQKFSVLTNRENIFGTYSHDTAAVNMNLLTILKVKLTIATVNGRTVS